MYNYTLHQQLHATLEEKNIAVAGSDNLFYTRFIANATAIDALYRELYGQHPQGAALFPKLINTITEAFISRSEVLKARDVSKEQQGHWFLSNELTGMSLYVDRFSGNIKSLEQKLPYFEKLGVNLLHLMPIFESPAGESDGGYAVSDFRKSGQSLRHPRRPPSSPGKDEREEYVPDARYRTQSYFSPS